MTLTPASLSSVDILDATSGLRGHTLASMLYGSHARGDARPDSDVDLLQLVPQSPRSYLVGSATVVAYTPAQLRMMSLQGSLFAWHLRTEGLIFRIPQGS